MATKIWKILTAISMFIFVVECSGGLFMKKMIEFSKPISNCDEEVKDNLQYNITNLGRNRYKFDIILFFPDNCESLDINCTAFVCDTVEETGCENVISFPVDLCGFLKSPGKWDHYTKNAEPPLVCPLKGWYKTKMEPDESFASAMSTFLGMRDDRFYGIKAEGRCKVSQKKHICLKLLYKLVYMKS